MDGCETNAFCRAGGPAGEGWDSGAHGWRNEAIWRARRAPHAWAARSFAKRTQFEC